MAEKLTEIKWHRLVDGDPKETGRYIVAHRATASLAIFTMPRTGRRGLILGGWNYDVSAFTHWAKEPCAPDDGTPQLFRAEGLRMRAEADEAAAWASIYEAGRAALHQDGEA